jgi:outer membrane protein OmpA-like peptidoglycan-associated protein
MMRKLFVAGIVVMFLFTTLFIGCAPENKAQKGAAIGAGAGAATGAVAGQMIGKDTKSTLVGAAVGAVAGAAIGGGVGHMMDKQEEEMRKALAESDAAAVRREQNLLAITLKGDVTFDVNSAKVKPGLVSELERIANVMVQYPDTRILVEGHTDNAGKEKYNQQLSERRAKAVMDILVQKGVAPTRMTAKGYGETMPVADNGTKEGRMQNRRVEIKIEPQG